jgi:hypothetical protein
VNYEGRNKLGFSDAIARDGREKNGDRERCVGEENYGTGEDEREG